MRARCARRTAEVVGTGRCSIAQRPLKRTGKSAASLSSGGMTGPRRWKVLKSLVVASETSGPPTEKAV